MDLVTGTRIDQYEILSRLGEGGMGEVYLAEDHQLGRKVAIKFLPSKFSADKEAKNRLIREARAAAKLDHPNICAIHSVGEDGNNSFIVLHYSLRNSNPLLLEQVFNDPTLRKTNFVIIHGGWPYIKEVAFLLGKPNIYADISAQTFMLYPRALSETIRAWLEIYPQKVLFGTDASPLTPEVNWEETGWLTTNTAREALALALTGMMNDHEVTRPRAVKLAHMVMRDNAIKLYGLHTN